MRTEPATRVALVVEDEWFVREHVVTELKAQGWSVVETATGENALAVLATDDVHLLLTDIQLAGAIDGWEVARALRAKKPDFPVIYASGTPPDPALRARACAPTDARRSVRSASATSPG